MKINEIYQKIKNLVLTKRKKFTSAEMSFISEFVLTDGSSNLERHWKCVLDTIHTFLHIQK